MDNINFFKINQSRFFLKNKPNDFEIVERKFRGHPDSLADVVAQRFSQLYIKRSWDLFPELKNNYFPNFSADKVTLSGATSEINFPNFKFIKPIDALLIGKITKRIGDKKINVADIFQDAVIETFSNFLNSDNFINSIRYHDFSAESAGVDHDKEFYSPSSIDKFLEIQKNDSKSNDTVFVVSFCPYTVAENLTIYLESVTYCDEFKKLFPEIGTDIKVMVVRKKQNFEITMCLPVMPEKISAIEVYEKVIFGAKEYLNYKISSFLKFFLNKDFYFNLSVNTKDTKIAKYFAILGTSLSKGDIGAVGRGNRPSGFISGSRPSSNEAFSGKNPNHFAGFIYQLVADEISKNIYCELGVNNTVYIQSNNGDNLSKPNSINITSHHLSIYNQNEIKSIVRSVIYDIPKLRMKFIEDDLYTKFLKSEYINKIYDC